MAYAALVSLEHTLENILHHHHFSLSDKQQIISLRDYIARFQSFLEEFSEKGRCLEGRIRDVANEAEDVLEYFMTDRSSLRLNKWIVVPGVLAGFLFKLQLREIGEKIDAIMEDVTNIQSSSSTIDDVVGLDDHVMVIKDRLCAESSRLQVIPIVGMGGIGKTTLARKAYEDKLTKEIFYVRAWITVSQDYNREEIISGLLTSMKLSKTDGSEKDGDGERVYKSLKGRRYLVVMDDMWSTKAWDDVRNLFPDDNNGSRIMVTSRLLDVAAYPDPLCHSHRMHLMKHDLSWDLLRKKVFMEEDCPFELESIGNEIARNCGGLPLAIVVIAGVLSTVSRTPNSWREIAENVKATFGAKAGHFEKILSLSYSHLPHHLRSCFLYMAGFPEDYEIRVSKLTKLWEAEGFLKQYPSTGSKAEAAKCLEDLIKRNLVLVTNTKSDFSVKSCRLHDLVRDMCIRKAAEEKFLQYVQKVLPEGVESQRRVTVANSGDDCLTEFAPSVRSVKLFRCGAVTAGSLRKFRLLRVLDLVFVEFSVPNRLIDSLPQPVCELTHLRYLAFMDYVRIPAAISNLQNLQALVMSTWKTSQDYPHDSAAVLPSAIWKMPQLRHLVSSFVDPLPDPEEETATLQNLQTLSMTTNFVCSRRVLGRIPNLQKLGIFYYCGEDKDDGEYHLENLVHLHHLQKLKIKIYANFPFREKLNPVFPRTLKKLTLSGFKVPWERITIAGSLPNLEVLKLRDFACKGSTWETTEGEFSELKYLLIDKSDLQHWITENSHFPRLRSLVLHRCWCLSEIPDDIGEIPTLQLIEVNGNKNLVESARRIEEEQRNLGNDSLQLHYLH